MNAKDTYDNEGIALWLCGRSGRSLEEEYGMQLSYEADQQRRAAETERDAAEHHCDGVMQCPEIEFDDHAEATCKYECFNGEVVCVCDALADEPTQQDSADVFERMLAENAK